MDRKQKLGKKKKSKITKPVDCILIKIKKIKTKVRGIKVDQIEMKPYKFSIFKLALCKIRYQS